MFLKVDLLVRVQWKGHSTNQSLPPPQWRPSSQRLCSKHRTLINSFPSIFSSGFLWRLQTARWATDFFFWSSAPKLTIRVFLFVQRTAGTCYSLQHFIDYLTHTVAVSPQLSITSLPHQAVFPAHYTNSTMFLLSFFINFFLHFSKCFPFKRCSSPRPFYLRNIWPGRYMKTNEWTCWITTEPSLICSFDFWLRSLAHIQILNFT